MAYWTRRPQGYVYVYTFQDGKRKSLPRKKTKHLDGQPDHNIQAWVTNWSLCNEGKKYQHIRYNIEGTELDRLLSRYLKYLAEEGRAEDTIKQHSLMLRRWIIPFFISFEPALNDPVQWPGSARYLQSWMRDHDSPESNLFRANVALRTFWDFLQLEGRVPQEIALKLRNVQTPNKATPLNFTISPEEVLSFVESSKDLDLKFIALAGYFFSLRPQEVFALKAIDFRGGPNVQPLDAAKAMNRVNLYDKFAVNVLKQRTNAGKLKDPKAGSSGWVCCFNREAALALVKLMDGLEPESPILKNDNRKIYRKWSQSGIQNLTIKDLRRSSLYWLGHFSDLRPFELQKHARHRSLETTSLYLRRPDEELQEWSGFDVSGM